MREKKKKKKRFVCVLIRSGLFHFFTQSIRLTLLALALVEPGLVLDALRLCAAEEGRAGAAVGGGAAEWVLVVGDAVLALRVLRSPATPHSPEVARALNRPLPACGFGVTPSRLRSSCGTSGRAGESADILRFLMRRKSAKSVAKRGKWEMAVFLYFKDHLIASALLFIAALYRCANSLILQVCKS